MATAELVKQAPALPPAVVERGINMSQWRTLFNLFPGAKPDSVLMVWDYCKSRQLDPMKKPCHIVPMRVKGADGQWNWRDVVMPGIYEYRITAHRTGLYLGHSEPQYGPELEHAGVKAPAWCTMTMFRFNREAQQRIEFPVKVYFAEVVATNKEGAANDRWSKAPIQMLTKCTEAAGLRETFPEEFGGEPTADEMEGRTIAPPEDEQPRERIQPGVRKSAQVVAEVPPPTVSTEPVATDSTAEHSTTPAEAPSYIGTIAEIIERGNGVVVKLNTGFVAATKNAAFVESLRTLHANNTLIDLETKPSSDPAKYAPSIVDITPISEESEG